MQGDLGNSTKGEKLEGKVLSLWRKEILRRGRTVIKNPRTDKYFGILMRKGTKGNTISSREYQRTS